MTSFVFPGQGSQSVGMGKDLCDNFAEARAVFEEAGDAISGDMKALCFDSDEQTLSLTFNAQSAILTVSIAALAVLRSEKDIKPGFVAGHSLGEYSALVCAGAIDFADAVRTVRERGRFMQETVAAGDGAMAAIIGLGREEVGNICKECSEDGGGVWPANYNSPEQTVISGVADAVERTSATALERGAKRAIPLKVSAPFHCPLMKPAAEKLAGFLEGVAIGDVEIPVVTNLHAKENSDPAKVKGILLDQITNPVRWTESVSRMAEKGTDRFIEIGPGRALCGLIRRTAAGAETLNLEMAEQLNRI
ncbi:MAG: ACP S-malonyltransferase [Candidatus Dadabacteria bacterium]|nr:ACP S-malonyltransferase [Candidatus Dadabacteria bacterium]